MSNVKSSTKLFLASLVFLPLATLAAGKDVNCRLQSLSSCPDCDKRIPVSCEEHLFNGSLEWKTKVDQAVWLISNPKIGTEHLVSSENKNWHLKDFKNTQNWKSMAEKSKIKLSPDEKITLDHVQVPAASALYTGQAATTVVAMKVQNPARAVASAGQDPVAGGVKRAQSKSNSK